MSYYLGLSYLSNSLGDSPAEGRAGDAKHDRQKLLSAEARRILSKFEGRPLTDNDIAREGQGKPYFPGSAADFNISHSGFLAAVALVQGAHLRTGCDVELLRPRIKTEAIARDYFSSSESEYVFSDGNFIEKRFYEIWTLKECFIKLRGLSVFDMAGIPSFIHDGEFALDTGSASALSFCLYELHTANECYILATAIEGAEEKPEIHWFSDTNMTYNAYRAIYNTGFHVYS